MRVSAVFAVWFCSAIPVLLRKMWISLAERSICRSLSIVRPTVFVAGLFYPTTGCGAEGPSSPTNRLAIKCAVP